jgi:hypothetical protein
MTQSKRIYVLDTNVLMHDPTALFKFEEHDVFLPMMVLEELDNNKKGQTESARNARQVSRFLNELVVAHGNRGIEGGISLLRPKELQLRAAEMLGRLAGVEGHQHAHQGARARLPPRTTSTTRCSRTPTSSTPACARAAGADFWDTHGKEPGVWQQNGAPSTASRPAVRGWRTSSSIWGETALHGAS